MLHSCGGFTSRTRRFMEFPGHLLSFPSRTARFLSVCPSLWLQTLSNPLRGPQPDPGVWLTIRITVCRDKAEHVGQWGGHSSRTGTRSTSCFARNVLCGLGQAPFPLWPWCYGKALSYRVAYRGISATVKEATPPTRSCLEFPSFLPRAEREWCRAVWGKAEWYSGRNAGLAFWNSKLEILHVGRI